MEDGAADHGVHAGASPRQLIELAGLKLVGREMRRVLRGDATDPRDGGRVAVDPEAVESTAEKIRKVAAVAAARIEDATAAIEAARSS